MRTDLIVAGLVACCDPTAMPTPISSPTADPGTPTPTGTPTATDVPASAPIIRAISPSTLGSPSGGDVTYCVSLRDPDSEGRISWDSWVSPNVGQLGGTMTSNEWQGGEGLVCFAASVELYSGIATPVRVTFHVRATDQDGLTDVVSAPWTITEEEGLCPAFDLSCSASLGLPSDVPIPTPAEP